MRETGEDMSGCTLIHEFRDRQTAGETLGPGEMALIDRHLAHCRDCRFEDEVVEAMAIDGADGPPPIADDLARRRMIDAVLEAAERPRSGFAAGQWLGLVAAVVVAVVVVAALSVTFDPGGGTPAAEESVVAATEAPEALIGRVLLASGETGVEGAMLDRGIAAGDRLPSSTGMTVIALGPGIRVALQPGADVRATRLDREEVAIAVGSGELLAWVEPDHEQPRFLIETPAGAIAVEGTVFRLEVAGRRVEVDVLRGKVTLLEPGREPRRVGIGESAVLGLDRGKPLDGSTEEEVRRVLGLLETLAARHDARVEIRSLPPGAMVSLDGIDLGATPLCASIRPGHRAIALDLPGHAPVREILEISRGDLVSRVFDLPPKARTETAVVPGAAGDPRPAAWPTAAELLVEAQTLRSARDWRGAVAAYDAIVGRHGASTEARSAAISSATIRLDHLGDPRAALELFDGYLARHGTGALAQEAAWGRCRALRALGREAEEREALERFVVGYPEALEARRARERLARLKN